MVREVLTIFLKGQWFLINDFSYTMNQIAWGIVIVAFVFSVLSLIWASLRKPLSRFMKAKETYVQVVYVSKATSYARSIRGVANPFLVVRLLDTKRKKRKKFYMNIQDIQEGDQGILRYQGAYGLEFKMDLQIVKKDYHQKFSFAKKKKEDQEVKVDNRTHHKRKYW